MIFKEFTLPNQLGTCFLMYRRNILDLPCSVEEQKQIPYPELRGALFPEGATCEV